MGQKKNSDSAVKNRLTAPGGYRLADAVAVIVFIALAAYYILSAFSLRGGLFHDEGWYYADAHRFALGDAPIVDEWHPAQSFFILLCPVFKLFYTLTGSTDGVVLFFRLLYVALKSAMYWGLYIALRRRYPVASVFVSGCLCAYEHLQFQTTSYYTLAPYFLCSAGLLLFMCENRKTVARFAAGCLFFCGVMTFPSLLFVCVVFAIAVIGLAVKNRLASRSGRECSHDPTGGPGTIRDLFSARSFVTMIAGSLLCGALTAAFLLSRASPAELLSGLPKLFDDAGHDDLFSVIREKAIAFGLLYSPALLLSAGCFILFAVSRRAGGQCAKVLEDKRTQAAVIFISLFISISVAFVLWSVVMPDLFFGPDVGSGAFLFSCEAFFIPVALFSLNAYVLLDKRDLSLLLFVVYGLLCSVCVDAVSNASFGLCVFVSCVPACLIYAELLGRLRRDAAPAADGGSLPAARKSRSFLSAAIPAALCAVLCASLFAAELARRPFDRIAFPEYYDDSLGDGTDREKTVFDDGIFKGMNAVTDVAEKYDSYDADARRMKDMFPDGTLYVDAVYPNVYLSADMRYGCHSVFTEGDRVISRQLEYLSLHPDREPDVIYVPYAKRACDLRKEFWLGVYPDREVVNGRMGYILIRPEELVP